ncbi:MAG: FAD-binding protein [Cytophagales bacterium]|nr:MAG: FAD-binding protein [Cytophagales bacterium]TAF61160.1 MAG: FAD-binding protein [Cytophagales bacterium]
MNYEVGILGGGLAGLSLSIRLAEAGLSVALFEKQDYPFHRMCGEYLSLESLPYIKRLGVDPFAHGAQRIDELVLSAPSGRSLSQMLPLGGFGLSRYCLDSLLAERAKSLGVKLFTKTQVLDITSSEQHRHLIHTHNQGEVVVALAIGTHGKRSNIDAKLKRQFYSKNTPYMAVKHHIRIQNFPSNQIALHNFKDGYCGFSRVEDGLYCLCYLTTRQNQKAFKTIKNMEQNLLSQNPFLKQIFEEAEFVWDKPIVINEISFEKKTLHENSVLMCGDAVGMITPLCGNGMSMALHGSMLLADLLLAEQAQAGRVVFSHQLAQNYEKIWNKHFAMRLRVGRSIQRFFGSEKLSDYLVRFFSRTPMLGRQLIQLTHGEAF